MPHTDHSRPNILVILTDQQSASMMSCAGNRYVQTPAMDSLAAAGVRFERAYCTNPVCVPSRFSLWTGRMPSEVGILSNAVHDLAPIHKAVTSGGLGRVVEEAGYTTAYAGKLHMPKLNVEDVGFRHYLTTDERENLSETCADFIRQPHDRPFLLVASFINPHDICYLAIRDFMVSDLERYIISKGVTEVATLEEALQWPDGVSREEFYARYCPPLPPNFAPQQNEPGALDILFTAYPFRRHVRERYTDEQWRLHRWAYARLTERVDGQIGRVLHALRESGRAEETVVIFTSDHGDLDAAHRLEHKCVLYEEAVRIPFIISGPGVTPTGAVDATHLVSNGLDLLPTICDYAGIAPPADVSGLSLRPLAEGGTPSSWRTDVPVETEAGGFALVANDYKYVRYATGENREQLYDRRNDPGEMRNALDDPEHQQALAALREAFDRRFAQQHALYLSSMDGATSTGSPEK